MTAVRDLSSVKGRASGHRPEIRRRLAVVVGVGTENARRDAKAVAGVLKHDYSFEVEQLLGEEATRQRIERIIGDHLGIADDATQWVFCFAGHGYKEGDKGYLIPAGALRESSDRWISVPELQDRCLQPDVVCAEILIVLDACHAGQALMRAEDLDGPMNPDPEKRRRVRQSLCAAGPKRPAAQDSGGEEGHSVFTYPFLEALRGWTEVHDEVGAVQFSALKNHVVKGVKRRLVEAGIPEDLQQIPIGGHFAGNDEQRDFVFRSVVPRVPPGTVQALRSEEAPRRLDGLARLVEHCREEPRRLLSAIPLARKCTQPRRGRDERVRAAKTLCQLAGSWGSEKEWPPPRRDVDHLLGEICRELALEDRSPAVRDWARRGLRRTGEATRSDAAGYLLQRYRTDSGTRRRRAWTAGVLFPEARRALPWITWWRIPLAWISLWLASFGWFLVETKSRRRWLTWSSTSVALLYASLGCTYYFSTSNQSTVVVRSGHPGFKILPGVGQTLVVTEYSVQDLKDPSLVAEERLVGFWPFLREGAWSWGEQLIEQLTPAEGGLAEWRMGEEERAFVRFREGIAAGDAEVVPLLGYVALHSDSAVRPAVDLLVQALASDATLHDSALAALAVVRDTRPAAAAKALTALAPRLHSVSSTEAVALIEAVEALADLQRPGGAPVPAALLELLRGHPGDSTLRLRIARALKTLVGRDPARLASVLPAVRESILHGPEEERRTWLSILDSPASLPPQVERAIVDVLADALAVETDPVRKDDLLKGLGGRLARSPSLAVSYVSVLAMHLGDREPGLRLTAARALASLPAGIAPGKAAVGALADLILSGERLELQIEAIEILGDLRSPDSREAAVTALIAAASQGNSLVRGAAVIRLVDQGLESVESAQRVLPVLRPLLSDPVPSIRQVAAQGVLFLSVDPGEDGIMSLGEVVRALGSEDPMEARIVRSSLQEWFPRAPFETRRRLVRGLAVHAGTLNVFTVGPIFDVLKELTQGQTDLLPDLALAFTGLLGVAGVDQDVQDLARNRLRELADRPEAQLAPATAALFERLQDPEEKARAAAAEVVGYLAAGHAGLAFEACRRLAPLLADPSAEVQASTATALGAIGRHQARAVRGLLDPLLTGLGSRSPALRTACAKALGVLELEPSLTGRVTPVLLAAVRDPYPEVRREAASALVHWGRRAWREMGVAVSPLRQQFRRESDPRVRDRLASALAVLGGEDPGVIRQVTGLARSWLASSEQHRRLGAVRLLGDLAETHPGTGRQVVEILQLLLRDPDGRVRLDTLVTFSVIGAADVKNAAIIVDTVGPLLLDPQWPSRWDAIANNLRPLVRKHPVLAAGTVRWLRELLTSGLGAEERHLGPEAVGTLIESIALQARSDPEVPWPLLTSVNRFEREVGQEALARIVAERPEKAPEIQERLAGYRRCLHPHKRLSAAQMAEMIVILRTTGELVGKPAAKRWRTVLENLPPRAGVQTAVHLALDKLEPEVKHG